MSPLARTVASLLLLAPATGCIDNDFSSLKHTEAGGPTFNAPTGSSTADLENDTEEESPGASHGTVGPDSGPVIQVSPGLLDYGAVMEGATAVQTFSVGNVGTAPLVVDDLRLPASATTFTVLSTENSATSAPYPAAPPFTLLPGEQATVAVAYTADATEHADTSLVVWSSDPESPEVPVALTAGPCDAYPSHQDFLAVPDPTWTGGVALMTYAGDFQFHPPVVQGERSGGDWHGLQVADFTGDGFLDVVARPKDSGALVLLSRVCGEIWSQRTLDAHLDYVPRGVADLDEDGDLDLYGTNADNGTGWVGLNRGDGTFDHRADRIDLAVTWSGYANRLSRTAEDLDQDGHVDLLASDYPNSIDTPSRIWFVKGNGDGTFEAPVRLPDIPTAVNSIDFADLDQNGHPDALLGMDDDGDSGRLFVIWNDGASLAAPELWVDQTGDHESGTNNQGAGWMALYDWTGDGQKDLLATFGFYTGAAPGERFAELGWHHYDTAGDWSHRTVVNAPGHLIHLSLATPVR